MQACRTVGDLSEKASIKYPWARSRGTKAEFNWRDMEEHSIQQEGRFEFLPASGCENT
jgi:hypothetical protein